MDLLRDWLAGSTARLAPAQTKITLELSLLKHKKPDHDVRLFYDL